MKRFQDLKWAFALACIAAASAGPAAMHLAGCASDATAARARRSTSGPTAQAAANSAQPDDLAAYILANYTKREAMIPMRDGVKLFTSIYAPKRGDERFPIMLCRTPYGVGPYGSDDFKNSLGPSEAFARQGFIFVYQDVRGTHMSEGEFENMRPHHANKQSPSDIDESTDAYDTIEWLQDNVAGNNGRVGMWGISYPGFYAAAGMIDAHPALRAVSPQAPVSDWYFDDFHHHGAFFLPHSFNFLAGFGRARPEPTTERWHRFDHGTPDGYQFFLDLGPLKNADERHFKGEIAFWNEIAAHPNYDAFWQARNILPHLNNVAPAVMTVGGWFDAEDLYGALQVYRSVEERNPRIFNMLVMGPWVHGGWARTDGDRLGNIRFGGKQSLHYRQHIELAFFNYFLNDRGENDLPEACMFQTGANRWRSFDAWPPAEAEQKAIYLDSRGRLSWSPPRDVPESETAFDEYVSDPAKPVPFTEEIATGMTKQYMIDDQRFAARRPDVLAYQTEPLEQDVTLAGPMLAGLWVSTSGTDSDWIVKLIDVFPNDAEDPEDITPGRRMGGYQMMVRSEVLRGRYRTSYEFPIPFTPDEPAEIRLPLQDVLHTFKAGHRITVQIQSTWFPLVDRNPQKYVDNVFMAEEADFIKATQRIYRDPQRPSRLLVNVLPEPAQARDISAD